MDTNQSKLTLHQKILVVIYILAIPIPFGVCILVCIYSILYYVFKMPLKKERDLLKYVVKKVLDYLKTNFLW